MSRRFFVSALPAAFALLLPFTALADDEAASVVRAQFTDKIESSKPVGDASSIARGQTATYWVEVSAKEPTQITLAWKIDGADAGTQSLDIGRSPHWRTWGSWPTRNAKTIEVHVLDKDGHELHADTLNLENK